MQRRYRKSTSTTWDELDGLTPEARQGSGDQGKDGQKCLEEVQATANFVVLVKACSGEHKKHIQPLVRKRLGLW